MDKYNLPPFDKDNFTPERYLIPSKVNGKDSIRTRDAEYGMWKYFGYKVGWEGKFFDTRQRALVALFQSYFVAENDKNKYYLETFGNPVSTKRMKRIMDYLETQISAKKDEGKFKKAVDGWERDRKWFITYLGKLYEEKSTFDMCSDIDPTKIELQEELHGLIDSPI